MYGRSLLAWPGHIGHETVRVARRTRQDHGGQGKSMATNRYRLVIGNKNWSSWSLRPWLAMRRTGVPFEEINVRLRQADSKAAIAKYSPSGMVPLLLDGDLAIWDSLAIIEYLSDAHPETALWPADRRARAVARSVAAEMHSSFVPLRSTCPMEILARNPLDPLPDDVAGNVRRIVGIWKECRRDYGKGGPFLFSGFTAADAMYAPVASRFRTYVPGLGAYGDDGTAAAYVDTIFAMPEMQAWIDGAKDEMAVSQG
jgi:glutathione S-transferase